TCKWAGKRQNSISQVMLVEGISIPKCLGMLVFPSRWRGPSRKPTRTMLGHAAIASLARLVAQQVKEARVRGQAPYQRAAGDQTTPACVGARPALCWGAGVYRPTLHRRRAGEQSVVPR